MIDYIIASILWIILVAIDLIVSIRLALMYKQDHDPRKLMFGIGLLFVMHTYVFPVYGLDSFTFSRRIFEWCSLPILFAFILSAANAQFKMSMSKCFNTFLAVTTLTIILFFIPLSVPSFPVLLTGLFFALILTFFQFSREFDLSNITLALSLPSFTICYFAIGLNMPELAIFSAFMAKAFLLLSFEISKRQTGIATTSFLVLQKELTGTKENLARVRERLLISERLATVGQLSTIVAHDLRNPLQSITNGIFCLKRTKEIGENGKVQKMLQNMEEAVNYSERIVKALLDYSENLVLEIRESDPHTIIAQTLSPMNIPKNIQIIDKTLCKSKIQVDIDKIVRASKIIIENAFDAMPSGGFLTITSRETKDCVEISFEDVGKGISKENLEKLTEPFFTTKAKGMGLGLPICKRIIDAHSGNLHVISTLDKGTTFTFTMPKVNNSKPSLDFLICEPKTAIFASKKRILKGGTNEN
jgi:signal transduction histidine kinase